MNFEYVEDVTLSEIKKKLTERSKDKELTFEQKNALEHAKLFAQLTPANTEKLKKDLLDMELSQEIATKIADIVPNNSQLSIILEKEKDIDDDKKQEILNVVQKYQK